MIEINLMPQETFFEKQTRQEKQEKAERMKNTLIGVVFLLVVVTGGVSVGYKLYGDRQEARAERQHQIEMAQKRKEAAQLKKQEAAEREREEIARKREERAYMLNDLTGKNFTAEQWTFSLRRKRQP